MTKKKWAYVLIVRRGDKYVRPYDFQNVRQTAKKRTPYEIFRHKRTILSPNVAV